MKFLQEKRMKSFVFFTAFYLVVLAVTATVFTEHPAPNKADFTSVYDKACFVPPTERRSNVDKMVLVKLSFARQALYGNNSTVEVFPNGTCGLDIYYYHPFVWFDPHFIPVIKEIETHFFDDYCMYEGNTTSLPWNLKLMTTGDSLYYNSVKLEPDDAFSRLPPFWQHGVIISAHSDFFTVGQHKIICRVPFLGEVLDSKYNLNLTVQINGCPFGRYGAFCNHTCSCVDGVECHSFNGACMCPAGLTGPRCEQSTTTSSDAMKNPNFSHGWACTTSNYTPRLGVQRKQVYIPYGTSHNLTCIAEGMIPTNYSWIKDSASTPLVTESRKKKVPYKPSPVIITAKVEALITTVNGGYICKVYDGNGNVYTQHVNVTVIAVPDPFLQVPQNQIALIDRNVTFTCKTKKVAGTIRWVRGNNPPTSAIKDEDGHYRVIYLPDGVSELHIYSVQFSDEDVYRCYVGYTFTEPDLNYKEANLIVQSDPRPTCSFPDVALVVSGLKMTFRCQVNKIKPMPSITWFIKGREEMPLPKTVTYLSSDYYSFDVSTSLTFVPVPEDDGMALYVAMESQAWVGSRKMSTLLDVKYEPIVDINPNPISLTVGEDADITCWTKGNPAPTINTWILSRLNEPPEVYSSTRDTYHLKDIDMTYDLASLTCRAGNEIGQTDDVALMKVTVNGFTPVATAAFSVAGGMCLLVLVLSVVLAYSFRKEVILWWSAKKDKTRDDKDFDIFISYKSGTRDEEFVVQELIPRLEQDGYRVCVHFRFFLPGRSIIDNISDAVRRSRKTLLLLTPGFVESEWCRYEFEAALLQMLNRQMDIIPVIFENLGNLGNLSEDLQTVLRTLSYITWPGAILDGRGGTQREADEEQFWRLMWESLPRSPLGLGEPSQDLPRGEEEESDDPQSGNFEDVELLIPV